MGILIQSSARKDVNMILNTHVKEKYLKDIIILDITQWKFCLHVFLPIATIPYAYNTVK